MKIKYKNAIKYLYIATMIINLAFFTYIANTIYSFVYIPVSGKKPVIVDSKNIKTENINTKKLDDIVEYIMNKN